MGKVKVRIRYGSGLARLAHRIANLFRMSEAFDVAGVEPSDDAADILVCIEGRGCYTAEEFRHVVHTLPNSFF